MSRPFSVLQAENKLNQLYTALKVGLLVPHTVLTNRAAALPQQSECEEYVIKALRSADIPSKDATQRYYSSPCPQWCDMMDAALSSAPVIVQRRIHAQFAIRLTVVGSDLFPVRVDWDASELDWRKASSQGAARFSVEHEVPAHVRDSIQKYMTTTDLTFGAFDFLVDKRQEWWFLECNPSGQWAWLDPLFEGRISYSMLEFLSAR
jgi:glutathione synthase/RimK-type ligase-like ATP-grasp enzyme